MSRELKFRVFIPDFDKFVYFDFNNFHYSDRYLYSDKHPVQQYTGLKDVDSNRIFEGDLLQFTARYKQEGNVPVIYSGASYGCIVTDERGLQEFWDLSHVVQQYYPKIVGNTQS